MNVNEAFPSNFLKADDLKGKNIVVTITDVQLEDIGKPGQAERKLVLSFAGKEKKLVCNKTNANTIAKLHGPETDHWIGKQIVIGPREVEFQGEMVWAVRVSLQTPPAAARPPAAAARPAPAPVAPDASEIPDDEVPF